MIPNITLPPSHACLASLASCSFHLAVAYLRRQACPMNDFVYPGDVEESVAQDNPLLPAPTSVE
jgi:hypothetical protein